MSKFWNDDSFSWEDAERDNEEPTKQMKHPSPLENRGPNIVWESIESSQVFLDNIPMSTGQQQEADCTRIVCISDTHGQHRNLFLPKGNVLIHAGDFTKSGEIGTIKDLSVYFANALKLNLTDEVICIAGNHDVTFHPKHYSKNWHDYHHERFDARLAPESLQNCTYLENSSCISKGDVQVYGSPWTPEFCDWAFNAQRGEEIDKIWQLIPNTTDVLITHGPPLGRGDLCSGGRHCRAGCYSLLTHVQERVQPRLHVFGHIHEGYGVSWDGTTLFVNASNLNLRYQLRNPCIVIDLPHDTSKPPMVVQPCCKVQSMQAFVEWVLQKDCFPALVDALSDGSLMLEEQEWPGNKVFYEHGYKELSGILRLHRNPAGRAELSRALSMLHAESYD